MIDLHTYRQLAQIEQSNAISIYIPTHRAGHVPEDRIRFKNQLQKVEAALEERGWNPKEIRKKTRVAKGSRQLETIAQRAIAGRVEVIFVEPDHEVWGNYNPQTHEVSLHENRKEDNIPLLEEATRSTILQGGSVYTVRPAEKQQTGKSTHAIFRYRST